MQIGTKSQTISLVPIIALTAAAVMSRRGTGYYPALQRELDDDRPMTAEQAETLKRLAKAAYELDAFKPNLTRAEADRAKAARRRGSEAAARRSGSQPAVSSAKGCGITEAPRAGAQPSRFS